MYSFPRLEILPAAVALPVLERLKEGVFVASEGAVDFGSARGLRVESYTWHLSSVEIEAGFQHLNLLCFFFFLLISSGLLARDAARFVSSQLTGRL